MGQPDHPNHPDHPPIEGGYTCFPGLRWELDTSYLSPPGARWLLKKNETVLGRVLHDHQGYSILSYVSGIWLFGYKDLHDAGNALIWFVGDYNSSTGKY